jgi:hypothetical protein
MRAIPDYVKPNVRARIKIERIIARRVVWDAIAAGFALNLDNGGDDFELPEPTTDKKKILNEMFATDDERLYFFQPNAKCNKGKPPKEWKWFGWVYFVYGNDGYDVMSDWTCNLNDVLKGAEAVSRKYG